MLRSLPLLVFVLALAGGASPSPAEARQRSLPERRASLVWVLVGEGKLGRPVLDPLGADVPEMLIDIANTPREVPRARMRALAALAFYPSEGSFAFLSSLLHERNLIGNTLGRNLRRQAIRSLGMAFGDRAVDDLVGLKSDEEPAVREAVAAALGDTGSRRALPALELWLTTEPDLTVRGAVDRAVSRLQGRP